MNPEPTAREEKTNPPCGSSPQEAGLRRMRRIALLALLAAACLMLTGHWLEPIHAWAGYLRAFGEAATVGALADWFAVVALFRRPLGLPLPHTAILPANKERVADALSTFLEDHFLTDSALGRRLRSMDFARHAARWIDESSDDIAALAAEQMARLPDIGPGHPVAAQAAEGLRHVLRHSDFAPAAGKSIENMLADGTASRVFRHLLLSSDDWIEDNRRVIHESILRDLPLGPDFLSSFPASRALGSWIGPLREQMAASLAASAVEKIHTLFREAREQPDHPLWRGFQAKLQCLAADLQSGNAIAGDFRAWQATAAESTVVGEITTTALHHARQFLRETSGNPDSPARQAMKFALSLMAEDLRANESVKAAFNGFFRDRVLAVVGAARPHARSWIAETIRGWDEREMAAKLELAVGRDLQFIRLNGTLIGGCVGLVLHALFQWFPGRIP